MLALYAPLDGKCSVAVVRLWLFLGESATEMDPTSSKIQRQQILRFMKDFAQNGSMDDKNQTNLHSQFKSLKTRIFTSRFTTEPVSRGKQMQVQERDF